MTIAGLLCQDWGLAGQGMINMGIDAMYGDEMRRWADQAEKDAQQPQQNPTARRPQPQRSYMNAEGDIDYQKILSHPKVVAQAQQLGMDQNDVVQLTNVVANRLQKAL